MFCQSNLSYDVELKPSRFAGQLVIITEKGDLMGQGGGITASYKSWVIFMEGGKSKSAEHLMHPMKCRSIPKKKSMQFIMPRIKKCPGEGNTVLGRRKRG